MLDVEVIGLERARDGLGASEIEELCALALASAAIDEGHLAVEFVDGERMQAVNREHRGVDAPTDVLAFPVDPPEDLQLDGAQPSAGPRELGDLLVCPEHTVDEREAVLHGALHLAGMDHESDEGEMLALQRELLRWRST